MNLADLKPWLAFGLLAALLLWETAAPFFFFPKGSARLAHGVKNMLLGITNGLINALGFAGLWWPAALAFMACGGGGIPRCAAARSVDLRLASDESSSAVLVALSSRPSL